MLGIFHVFCCLLIFSKQLIFGKFSQENHPVVFVPYSHVITCWERADFLALLYVVFSYVCVTFPFGVPGQVTYCIVSISDLCLLLYFVGCKMGTK